MAHVPAWATTSGDVWAERWRELDQGLAGVAAYLDPTILAAAPGGPFRALDIGCGAGSTSLALAHVRPDASIIACDLSPSLIELATHRFAETSIDARLDDAEQVAAGTGPFDLIYSRHGVMFFADPPRAFRSFRTAAAPGATLVFSCFEAWEDNHWASQLANAAAGHPVKPPAREPGAFAFADHANVRSVLESGGWTDIEPRSFRFDYVAGLGENASAEALSLFSAIGAASAILRDLDDHARALAVERMRRAIERHLIGDKIIFPASACLWSARAGA